MNKLFALLLIIPLLLSCSSDDDDQISNTDIVGSWLSEGNTYNDLMKFESDYRCIWLAIDKEKGSVIKEVVTNITYVITKKNITLTYDDPLDVEAGVKNPYRSSIVYDYSVYEDGGEIKLKMHSDYLKQTTILTKQ